MTNMGSAMSRSWSAWAVVAPGQVGVSIGNTWPSWVTPLVWDAWRDTPANPINPQKPCLNSAGFILDEVYFITDMIISELTPTT